MAEGFSAFSFVDRITDIEPGVRARGGFTIPAGLADFSPGLVAEAIGQLAAWLAMAHADFQRRPVAALAGETRIVRHAAPGQRLDLGVEMESVDADAIAYRGWARVRDATIIELERCVGPMLPMEDFDAPDLVRQQFALLTGAGARPGRLAGLAQAPVVAIDREPGRRARAALHVPAAAPLFADHFPRRPVFPATLLLDAHIRLAAELAQEVLSPCVGARPQPSRLMDVKLRSFILPGAVVEMEAVVQSHTSAAVTVALTATLNGKRISTARVEIVEQVAS
jgi:3-hydroxymyristoyl/3-hydroxydecanoyl-(acyl carrier protein) dehydratase